MVTQFSDEEIAMRVLSTYHSSPAKILLPVVSCLAALEAPLILMLMNFEPDEATPVLVSIAFFILPSLAIIAFFLLWVKIEITDRDVRFYRFGSAFMIIPFANHTFQRFSYLEAVNRLTDISHQYLRVIFPNGRLKDIHYYAIAQNKFDGFISEVISLSEKMKAVDGYYNIETEVVRSTQDRYAASGENLESELPIGGVSYIFPKKVLLKILFKKYLICSFIVVIAICLITDGVASSLLENVPLSDKLLYALMAPAGILLLIIIGLVCLIWLSYQKKSRSVPETIRITANSINIDDKTIPLREIMQIRMPIIGNSRVLIIETIDKTKKYFLGPCTTKRNTFSYREYSALFRSIDAFMRQVGKRAL